MKIIYILFGTLALILAAVLFNHRRLNWLCSQLSMTHQIPFPNPSAEREFQRNRLARWREAA